jgi:glycosyltransferase involved in cell wall biosynthesis
MARILFLAPQPFYLERGTPIAIDLTLRALEADGHQIDLVTYPEGENLSYQRVRQYRVLQVPWVKNVPPGFSWKKLLYSSLMVFTAFRLAFRNRYDFVHAGEDACFIALFLRLVRRLPYIYDMDSSIAQQMVEKRPGFTPLSGLFNWIEGLAIRYAFAVIAVCPALVDLARKNGAKRVLLLQDISLLDRCKPGTDITDLRREMATNAVLLLYVGNLESYQGIDLLLDSFTLATQGGTEAAMAIIGGRPQDVSHYQQKAQQLGISDRCHFFGPRPVSDISAYLAQADILLSPRSIGNNTPMKIYTYLATGKALLATRIVSHTQALDDSIACLVEPTPQEMAKGIKQLCSDADLRLKLGTAAQRHAKKHHTFKVYREKLTTFYQQLEIQIGGRHFESN